MGYVVIFVIVAIVVGEVFLTKLYNDGGKQFKKYDVDNSNVQVASAEELASKLRTIIDLGISGVECNGNNVNVICKNNNYSINVDNGIASIEYDCSKIGFSFSKIGKILKMRKFIKSTEKAIVINKVMDRIACKDVLQEDKEYKKIKIDKTGMMISLILAIISVVIAAVISMGATHGEAVEKVKNTEYCAGITYEDLIDVYLDEPEWKSFVSDTSTAIVEVNGTSIEGDTMCIQFKGDLGVGYNSIGSQEFTLDYFDVNGEPVDPFEVMDYIYGYLYY